MTVTVDELRAIDLFEGVADERLAEWVAARRRSAGSSRARRS